MGREFKGVWENPHQQTFLLREVNSLGHALWLRICSQGELEQGVRETSWNDTGVLEKWLPSHAHTWRKRPQVCIISTGLEIEMETGQSEITEPFLRVGLLSNLHSQQSGAVAEAVRHPGLLSSWDRAVMAHPTPSQSPRTLAPPSPRGLPCPAQARGGRGFPVWHWGLLRRTSLPFPP